MGLSVGYQVRGWSDATRDGLYHRNHPDERSRLAPQAESPRPVPDKRVIQSAVLVRDREFDDPADGAGGGGVQVDTPRAVVNERVGQDTRVP
jgi:hypothetical protein